MLKVSICLEKKLFGGKKIFLKGKKKKQDTIRLLTQIEVE